MVLSLKLVSRRSFHPLESLNVLGISNLENIDWMFIQINDKPKDKHVEKLT